MLFKRKKKEEAIEELVEDEALVEESQEIQEESITVESEDVAIEVEEEITPKQEISQVMEIIEEETKDIYTPIKAEEYLDDLAMVDRPDTLLNRDIKKDRDEILIVGCGAVGSYFAYKFYRAGFDICSISSVLRNKMVSQEGIRFTDKDRNGVKFLIKQSLWVKKKPKLVIFATKSSDLDVAMTMIDENKIKDVPILSLVNGADSLVKLRGKFGNKVCVGFVDGYFAKEGDGGIRQLKINNSEVFIANRRVTEDRQLNKISQLFASADIDMQMAESEEFVLWNKQARYSFVSLIDAYLSFFNEKFANSEEINNFVDEVAEEYIRIIRHRGEEITKEEMLHSFYELPENHILPLKRSIAKGESGELESLAGILIKYANLNDVKCDKIKMIIREIYNKIS